jgi:ATP-dependent helicase/nuclease subunit A
MMASRTPIPSDDPGIPQRQAADPGASVWVSASAGTGKTKVLTDRVLALLLRHVAPERILCLTYTRAAAAEMAVRVQTALGAWAVVEQDKLNSEIKTLTGIMPDAETRQYARGLFARVLDCPGGLKIQTIHGFCESLLRRFPIEAGLAPHFQVLEEIEARELLIDARDEVLARATGIGPQGGDDALARAVEGIAGRLSAEDFDKLMARLAGERGRIARLIAAKGGLDGAIKALASVLGVGKDETESDIITAACADGAFDRAGLTAAAVAMVEGSKTDTGKAAGITAWIAGDGEARANGYENYRAVFHKKTDGAIFERLVTAGLLKKAADPDRLLAAMRTEAERLLDVEARRRAGRTARASIAALTIGAALIEAYAARKSARARLDYDDLILHTRALLSTRSATQWVLYKLDGGIEHVLVDEAQDTSPDQWEVIRRLTGEFFTGFSAREDRSDDHPLPTRTVFAVGDAKQSIYSFQRADPRGFSDMRDHYCAAVEGAGAEFRDVELHHSFRSTAPVLGVVDNVFAASPARDGLADQTSIISHITRRDGQAGQVELWPAVEPGDAAPVQPWQPDPEPETGGGADSRLARLMAEKIKSWIGTMDLPSRGRKLQAGDVLVLVRTRTRLVDGLVRALKRLDVGVAGVDRMKLAGELAVQDLLALGRFLLLPDDDYMLACVLKGPYAGLDDDDLLALAPRRPGSLWAALNARAGENPKWLAARDWLAGLLARTDFARPFELFAAVLDEDDGRARLIARLGSEAEDPVNEFLELALAFERSQTPSLQGFLRWFESGQSDIKRDLEQANRDEVRIMTVHGAKGLQAPVVILPDTMSAPRPVEGPYWTDAGDGAEMPLWTPLTRDLAPQAAALRAQATAAQAEEYHRLLYVALTRAEDALFIAGWRGRNKPPADCWYDLVKRGLAAIAETETFTFTDAVTGISGEGLRYARPQAPDAATHWGASDKATVRSGAPVLKGWERTPAPQEAPDRRPLAPSLVDGDDEPAVLSPLGPDSAHRFLKGRLVHGLLQLLPDIAPAAREEAAQRFLARPGLGLDEKMRASIARETLALLVEPGFASLFGPGSLAEVPITGIIDGDVVSGQIDRLVVSADKVLVVDYKTARPVPEDTSRVPNAYLRQMALYRAVLKGVFPDHAITCALLYTAAPKLITLPDGQLDGVLA